MYSDQDKKEEKHLCVIKLGFGEWETQIHIWKIG